MGCRQQTEDLDDTEVVKTIDSFIYRFTKIQDKMGEKLFPAILNEFQEYKPNMPLIDVLNKLEKFELIDNVDMWIDFRKLRNNLTHDYPNSGDNRSNQFINNNLFENERYLS